MGILGTSGLSEIARLSAADPATRKGELQAQVRSLLQELDADQRARRQKAERELLDLGQGILPILPPPELLPNQAVRTTVARIRVILERRQAQESVQPTHITTPKPLTLSAWLRQLEAQTTNQIDATAVPASVAESQINQTPQTSFWHAFDAVLPQNHLRFQFAPDSSTLRIVPETAPGADAAWKVAIDGPFRVAVDSVKTRKVAGNAQQQRLRTELSVAPEPRLRALFLKLAAKDFQATGPGGRVFAAADPAAQFDLPLGEGGRFVRWNLDFAANSAIPEIEIFPLKIEGQAMMQIAAASEHIRFTDLVDGAGTARRRGGVTVAVQKIQAKLQPDGTQTVSIKVLVAYDTGGPAFESHRTWIFHNEVYLDRQEGAPLPPNGGFETDLQTNGSVGVTYHFQGLKGSLADYEFVYVAPTLIVDVPIKIRLEAIRPPAPSK
ncbi:MAG: hypothetical protein JWN70_749 [Planctomycetaceae bacterium]|nr:hypothetical protein [Planctomycetaceae bacterium]